MRAKCFENEVVIFWDPPKDYNNENYFIYQDGIKIGETRKTHFSVKNLKENTCYTFSVTTETDTNKISETKKTHFSLKNSQETTYYTFSVTKENTIATPKGIEVKTLKSKTSINSKKFFFY